jgi:hypothetical protein
MWVADSRQRRLDLHIARQAMAFAPGSGRGFVLSIVRTSRYFSGPPSARGILIRADRL